jgi:hypothetical protein
MSLDNPGLTHTELTRLHDGLAHRDGRSMGRCAVCSRRVTSTDEFVWKFGELFHTDCARHRSGNGRKEVWPWSST